MRDLASRRGAANLGIPLMIAAFIVIGGFLYWLFLQAEAERQLELEAAARIAAEEAEREAMGQILDPAQVQTDASPFLGRTVTFEDIEVQGRLGSQGVWVEMPNGNPFLVSFSDSVKAAGASPEAGQLATITGMMQAMSDSVAGAWVATGSINEGDRLAAEFATHFLEATRVRVTGTAPPDEGEGEAAGADGN